MKPQIVKLITSEELIAKVESEGDFYNIKDAYMLVPSREGVGMVPWLPFAADNTVSKVSKSHVLTIAEPVAEIRDSYVANVGGIVLAGSVPPVQGGGLRLVD
jgi:hypothetical protein